MTAYRMGKSLEFPAYTSGSTVATESWAGPGNEASSDHRQRSSCQLLGSEGGSPPTKIARLDLSACSETYVS